MGKLKLSQLQGNVQRVYIEASEQVRRLDCWYAALLAGAAKAIMLVDGLPVHIVAGDDMANFDRVFQNQRALAVEGYLSGECHWQLLCRWC